MGHGPIQAKVDPLTTRADVEQAVGQPVSTFNLPAGRMLATYEYRAAEPNDRFAEGILGFDFLSLGLAEIYWGVQTYRGFVPPSESYRRTVTYGSGGEVLANSLWGWPIYLEEAEKLEKAGDVQGAGVLRDAAARFYPAQ